MDATKFSWSSIVSCYRPLRVTSLPCRRRKVLYVSCRGRNGRDHGGRLVDENMIVLRIRMRELQMLESSCDPPSHWMEWEKRYFIHYHDAHLFRAIGLLQNYLMNVRPSLALGSVALVTLGVAVSTGMGLFHAAEIVKSVLFEFHFS